MFSFSERDFYDGDRNGKRKSASQQSAAADMGACGQPNVPVELHKEIPVCRSPEEKRARRELIKGEKRKPSASNSVAEEEKVEFLRGEKRKPSSQIPDVRGEDVRVVDASTPVGMFVKIDISEGGTKVTLLSRYWEEGAVKEGTVAVKEILANGADDEATRQERQDWAVGSLAGLIDDLGYLKPEVFGEITKLEPKSDDSVPEGEA